MTQSEFDFSGEDLRDRGMQQAVDHADEVKGGWSTLALTFVEHYAMNNPTFSGEKVRAAAAGIVPEPPHLRAWGGVMMKAAKMGMIRKCGYVQVDNPLAHKATAALWKSNYFK
jgi:hypothetical protein